MNLSNPGEELLSRQETSILKACYFAPSGLSGRKLFKVADLPYGGNSVMILRKLSTIGLLSEQQKGNLILYSINENHIFWDAIYKIIFAREEVFVYIREILEDRIANIQSIRIFGSTARKDSTLESDIDILVIINGDEPEECIREEESQEEYSERIKFYETSKIDPKLTIEENIHRRTGNSVQLIIVSEETLAEMEENNDPFVNSVKNESILLAGNVAYRFHRSETH